MERRRYTTIEGMRGVAALAVLLLHAYPILGAAAPMSAYLAVDFFFVLSGFVMAHAYGERLEHGMPGWVFLRDRVIRLYPLYAVGTAFGLAVSVWSVLRHSDTLWNFTQPGTTLPFALFMLPSPASSSPMFPLDMPAWSLLLELIANAVFAVAWLRRVPVLLAFAAASAIGLLLADHLDMGGEKVSALGGLARVGFSFPVGVLLYRVHRRWRLPAAPSVVLILILIAYMCFAPSNVRLSDLAFVFALSPALLLAGAAAGPANARLTRFYVVLGAISYPLYALHDPILEAGISTIGRHVPSGIASIAAGWALVVSLVVMSYGAGHLDKYVRGRLSSLLRPQAIAAETS